MKHKYHRSFKRMHKKYKRIAAVVAGAAILSGAAISGALPAIPTVAKDAGSPPAVVAEQAGGNVAADQGAATPNPDGNPAANPKELNIVATAYAPGPHDNDQWGNKTFQGTRIRPGVIAVDPRVIPLGSRVSIHYPDGHKEYATAEDTGGAIKGNRIDVAKRSVREAQNFGIKRVKVVVDEPPQNA